MTEQQVQWSEWAQITSVPLCQENEAGEVIAAASGCLIQYRNRRFLLTVAHAVPGSRWAILLGFDAEANLFEVYRLRGFNAVAVTRRQWVDLRDLDFCFEEVGPDVDPVFEHRTPMGVFSERRARHVFATDLATPPRAGQMYAFSGEIKAERHGRDWVSTSVTYPGLRYASSNGEFHTFQIPVPHPGHESFMGCSGAPIVGEDREAVALVLRGDEEANTITGISLSFVKPTLDLYCASIPSPYPAS